MVSHRLYFSCSYAQRYILMALGSLPPPVSLSLSPILCPSGSTCAFANLLYEVSPFTAVCNGRRGSRCQRATAVINFLNKRMAWHRPTYSCRCTFHNTVDVMHKYTCSSRLMTFLCHTKGIKSPWQQPFVQTQTYLNEFIEIDCFDLIKKNVLPGPRFSEYWLFSVFDDFNICLFLMETGQ